MIDSIVNHIFIYNISSYLNLKDKKVIKQCNKYFKEIIDKKIFSHIGNILFYHLGYERNNFKDFKKDINTFSEQNVLSIINTLLSFGFFERVKQKVFITKSISNLKAGVLFRILSSSINECNNVLKTKKIFRRFKANNNKYNNLACKNNNMYIRKKLPLAYSLTLSDSICII